MTARALVDRMEARVGFCTQTAAKLTIVALQDAGTLSVSCSGGSVSITTPLTGIGDDHPTHGSGQFPLYYAHVDITGLAAGQVYTWQATKNGISIAGTLRTLPAEGQDFAFAMSTCEHGEQYSPVDVHQVMREYCEAQEVPTYWYAHIDDLWYVDSMRDWGGAGSLATDPSTGIGLSNPGAGGDPQDTGLAWDYAVNWAGYFGLLHKWPYSRRESRLWWHRNMPMWAQWGDHEVASNWQRGFGGQGDWYGPHEWDGVVLEADFAPVGTDDFFAQVAKPLWEALFSQAMPPRLRAGGQHWGVSVGPVAFTAPDMNTYADGRHGLTTGTGADSGRQADGSVNAATGDATLPYLGGDQIGDLLGYYGAQAKPFNIVFTANGICNHNEPWGQWWVNDFDDFVKRAGVGVLNSAGLNGTTGKLCVLKGDSHAIHVVSYRSDGTAGGLGGASYSGHELWEICPGTLNGSGTAGVTFPYKILRQRVHLKRDATGPRGRDYHAFLHVTVHASETPQRMVVRMVETTSGQAEVIWQGQWRADVAGNGFARVNEAQNIG